MFLLLEGPEGAGKSTLAASLAKLLPGVITAHHGPYIGATGREISQAMMSSLRPAFEGANLIIDRCWLSEPIYAHVFRKQPPRISAAQRRMLERAALAAGGVVVFCRPSLEACNKAFLSGREEMLETLEQLGQVYHGYRHMVTSLPVVEYDYEKTTPEELLEQLQRVRPRNSRVVLLCEKANTKVKGQAKFQVPFVAFKGEGCSEWLADQLEAAGIDEADLVWRNVFAPDGPALSPEGLPQCPIITLSRVASKWCQERNLPHQLCPHPAAHIKFHPEKPYPLIKMLQGILQ